VEFGILLIWSALFYFHESTRENLYLRITKQKEEITSQRDEIIAQRDIVTEQKEKFETANSQIMASLTYARYIQSSILPMKEKLDSYLKDYFILFKPRDILSGDFYWLSNI
jgi:serine phosphatase RsbU (regulator of sigma subunit)